MIDSNLIATLTTLNVNVLSKPIKRQRLSDENTRNNERIPHIKASSSNTIEEQGAQFPVNLVFLALYLVSLTTSLAVTEAKGTGMRICLTN